jgi:hypothetical protein
MSVESVLQRVAALEQALSNPAALLAASARTGGTAAPGALSETAPEAASASGVSSFADALQSASAGYGGAAPATVPALGAAMNQTPNATAGSSLAVTAYSNAAAGVSGAAVPAAYPASAIASVAGLGTSTPSLSAGALGGGTGARIIAIAESQLGQAEQPPGSNESPAIALYRGATSGAVPGAPWCAYFASWAARQAGAPLGTQGEGLGSVSAIWSWAQSTGRAIANGPGVKPQPGDLIVFGGEHVGIVKGVLPNGDIQTVEGNYENKVALNVRTSSEATGYVNMN